jgi:hypothetical protein
VELQGIIDLSASGCGSGSPCIDPIFGPTKSGNFWSATIYAGGPDFAWTVYFTGGFVTYAYEASSGCVRAVRSGL